MTTAARLPSLQQPLSLWTDLALETSEMLVASAQVIGHRSGRMARAGPLPSEQDQQEFTLMGQEKVEAATQSATAMGQQMLKLGTGFGLRAWRDMCAATQATIALAASRSADETTGRQAELAQSLTRSALSMSGLGNVGARIARRGLRPIHAAATANARRLAVG